MTIGIVGAGISGLTLAWELQQRGIDYHLWEARDEPGGYIRSRCDPAGYVRELGPNSLLGDDTLLAWLDELGLTPHLVFANPVSKARFIFRDGKYRALPSGPASLLFGRIGEPSYFSWKTKWAIFRELSNKTKSPPGETLGQFFRRRFTPELVDYAVGPFVAGIYAGDPEQLLVSETFPSLIAYERDYGSVLRGFIKNQSSAVRKQSFSFTDGMQMLPNALASRLTNLSLNDPVQKIRRVGSGWRVTGVSGITTVDQLVLATGTDAAARLVQSYNPELARSLWAINYPYMTAVHSVYRRTDVSHPLNGFGGLNPKKENRFCAGHIWSSSLFAGRCPTDEVLFTTFVGGSQSPDNARQPDEVIFENVHRELAGSFGISASAPVFRDLYRWERAIPQYDAKLAALKPLVAAAVGDQLRVCANWYGGLSLPDCIGKARAMAGEIETKSLINKF